MSGIQTLDWGVPGFPVAPPMSIDKLSLAQIRDLCTNAELDPYVSGVLFEAFANQDGVTRKSQLCEVVRSVLDQIRELPRGDARYQAMNTVVRILGQPHNLAAYVDAILSAADEEGTIAAEMCHESYRGDMHAIYGWVGQSLIATSSSTPTPGTIAPEHGVQELIGSVPTSKWGISIHIWQPNDCAIPFQSGMRPCPGYIVEPPHSHPFEFSSFVVVGEMRQSIYRPRRSGLEDSTDMGVNGRYDDVDLIDVDGVWPPHKQANITRVNTVENEVVLTTSDSYFLPIDKIHDVQLLRDSAVRQPTITLFLSSEFVVIPHVYVCRAMFDYHAEHDFLKNSGAELSKTSWLKKMSLIAEYLRGESSTLELDPIVNHENSYSFFHE